MKLAIRKNMMSRTVINKLGLSSMKPIGVCIHNTANDASASNEITYMNRGVNPALVSYHYAVDDKEAVQGLPHSTHGWHAGDGRNGDGNRKYIAIEICYSKSGGKRFTQSEKNGAYLAAKVLHDNKWGISRMKKHQDFSGKRCPHRTLDLGWNRFVNMVTKELNVMNQPAKPSIVYKKITPKKVELTKDASLWNFDFVTWADAKPVKSYKKGHVVDVVAQATNQLGGVYYMTAYSYNNGNIRSTHGFNKADTKNYTVAPPPKPPAPKPPENCDAIAKKLADKTKKLNDQIDQNVVQKEEMNLLHQDVKDLRGEVSDLEKENTKLQKRNADLELELGTNGELTAWQHFQLFVKKLFNL